MLQQMVSHPVVSSPHLPHGYLGFLLALAPPPDVGVAVWEAGASSVVGGAVAAAAAAAAAAASVFALFGIRVARFTFARLDSISLILSFTESRSYVSFLIARMRH